MFDASTANDLATPRRLPAGRKADLAKYIADAGEVTVAELAERFDVSTDTIRRDLDQLDSDGLIIRTHGGAVSLTSTPRADTGLDLRLKFQSDAKERIGKAAANLVQNDSVIMINAGTTTLALARNLADHHGLTVATNNLLIPAEISPQSFRGLYVFGGAVHPADQKTVGPVAFQAVGGAVEMDVQCDLVLLGIGAVSIATGYSTSNLEEAAMMTEMIARATRVAILADSTKFGRRLFAQVAELERADYFVTDATPPADLGEVFARGNVEVIVA